ncbi:catalase/peroxidase HPI [Phytophthora cinnamomi]|uniref:catalase/peroxidase HPI n=1 Tax=Phytophthora cinnamomi TaxID=4785 RepID=UPI00355942D9|nr:catalase/peroxidase HPI [Phytophthora cinnamomi]
MFTREDVPGPPEKVLMSPASDSAVRVQFFPPLHVKPEGVNGALGLRYRVELTRCVDEVQTFTSVKVLYPTLSTVDLIELAGQVALKDAGNVTIDFLDGCTDSNNGNGTEILVPCEYYVTTPISVAA